MSTQAQKFLQKLASSSSFDINVSNFKPHNNNINNSSFSSSTTTTSSSSSSPSISASPSLPPSSSFSKQQHQYEYNNKSGSNVEYELRLAQQEKKLLEEELRKTKNNLDAVVSELVLSENEV